MNDKSRNDLNFLHAVLENAGALLIVLDREGRIRSFNRACESASGYRFAEVEGRCPWDFLLPPEQADTIRKQAFETLANKPQPVGRYTNEWLSKDGKRFLIEWTNTLLRDADGEMEYMVSVGTDITEQRQSLEAARSATALLHSVIENIPSMIFVKRADDLRFSMFNRAGEALLGFRRDELIGKCDYDFFPPEQADFFTARDRKVLHETGHEDIAEEPIDTRLHGRRILHTQKIALKDAQGRPEFLLGISEDITERKAAEDALQANNQLLAAVLDTTPVLIAYLDPDLNFVRVNRAYAEADGKTPDYFVGQNHFALFPNAENEAIFRRVLENGEPHAAQAKPFEYAHSPERGTSHWDWTLTPIKDDAGKITGLVLSLTNVTERVAALEAAENSGQALMALTESLEARILERTRDLSLAKESAERSNRAKSEFLSRMSHELRTPLNAILGFAQVLELEGIAPEHLDHIQEIHRAGDHLLHLINELLDLSRIETGKLAVLVQPISLQAALSQALQITQPMREARQIALLHYCTGDMLVQADATRLCQILVNLLSNAVKYNHAGGRITVACQPQADAMLRIAVADTGPGIPPEKHALLFRPFERLGAEQTEVEGVGIGLALSKQLAELMGARIGVDSTPGVGSTFWLDLPLASLSMPLTDSTRQPAVAQNSHKCHVLYVEDNAANLKLVEVLLRRQPDIDLIAATNGEFGLELARRYQPDAILLDIHLPGLDGYALLQALQADAATSAIPVLALSADAMPIDVERGLQAGFKRYLTKPINGQELIAAIRAVV